MRISVPGACKRREGVGFTLIEMLVVMLIMGLLLGLVSAIARPDERNPLRLEAERLAQLLDLAAMESQSSGKPIGWVSDGMGYRFERWLGTTGWSEIRDNDLLRPRTLASSIKITGLQVESTRSPGSMRLEFLPYRPALVFAIELSSGSTRYTVSGSPVGEVRVLAPDGAGHGAPSR